MKSYGPSIILRSHVDEINCVNITVLDLKLLLIWDFFFGINFGIIYPFPSSLSNCFRDWPVLGSYCVATVVQMPLKPNAVVWKHTYAQLTRRIGNNRLALNLQ
jgi:hypothetical protein